MWPHVLHIIITMQYVCSSYKYDPFERIRLCAGGRLQSTSCCVGSASTLGFSAHAADIRQASYQPWCAMANNPHHIKVGRHNAGNGRMLFVCWGIFFSRSLSLSVIFCRHRWLHVNFFDINTTSCMESELKMPPGIRSHGKGSVLCWEFYKVPSYVFSLSLYLSMMYLVGPRANLACLLGLRSMRRPCCWCCCSAVDVRADFSRTMDPVVSRISEHRRHFEASGMTTTTSWLMQSIHQPLTFSPCSISIGLLLLLRVKLVHYANIPQSNGTPICV